MITASNEGSAYHPVTRPMTPGQQVWDFHANFLNHIIAKSYEDWPLNSGVRREMLSYALEKAEASLKPYAQITDREKGQLLLNYAGAFSADAQHHKEAVCDFVGSWMYVFSMAIQRSGL